MQLCDLWDSLPGTARETVLKAIIPTYIEYLIKNNRYDDAAALAANAKKYIGDVADLVEIIARLHDIAEELSALSTATATPEQISGYIDELLSLKEWLSRLNIPPGTKENLSRYIDDIVSRLRSAEEKLRDYTIDKKALDYVKKIMDEMRSAFNKLEANDLVGALRGLERTNQDIANAMKWFNTLEHATTEAELAKYILEEASIVASSISAGIRSLLQADYYLHLKAGNVEELVDNLAKAFNELAAGYYTLTSGLERANIVLGRIDSIASTNPRVYGELDNLATQLRNALAAFTDGFYDTIKRLYENTAAKDREVKRIVDGILRNYNVPIPRVELSPVENLLSYIKGFITYTELAKDFLKHHYGILGKLGALAESIAKAAASILMLPYLGAETLIDTAKAIASGDFHKALEIQLNVLKALKPEDIYDLIAMVLLAAALGGLYSRLSSAAEAGTGVTASLARAGLTVMRAWDLAVEVTNPALAVLGRALAKVLSLTANTLKGVDEELRNSSDILKEIEGRYSIDSRFIEETVAMNKQLENVSPETLAELLTRQLFPELPSEARLAVARELADTLAKYIERGGDVFEAIKNLEGKEILDVTGTLSDLSNDLTAVLNRIESEIERAREQLGRVKSVEIVFSNKPVELIDKSLSMLENLRTMLGEYVKELSRSGLDKIIGKEYLDELLDKLREIEEKAGTSAEALEDMRSVLTGLRDVARELVASEKPIEQAVEDVRERLAELARRLGSKSLENEAYLAPAARIGEVLTRLASKTTEMTIDELSELRNLIDRYETDVLSRLANKLLPLMGRVASVLEIELPDVKEEMTRLRETARTIETIINKRLGEIGSAVREIAAILREEAAKYPATEEGSKLAELAYELREAYRKAAEGKSLEPLVKALREVVSYLDRSGLVETTREIIDALNKLPMNKDIETIRDILLREYREAEETVAKLVKAKAIRGLSDIRSVINSVSETLQELGYSDVAKDVMARFEKELGEGKSVEQAYADSIDVMLEELRKRGISAEKAARLSEELEKLSERLRTITPRELSFVYEDLLKVARDIRSLGKARGLISRYEVNIYNVKVRAASPEIVNAVMRLLSEPERRIVITRPEGIYVVERAVRRTPDGFEIEYYARAPDGTWLRLVERIRSYEERLPGGETVERQMVSRIIDYDPVLADRPGEISRLAEIIDEAAREDIVGGRSVLDLLREVYVEGGDLATPLLDMVERLVSLVPLETGYNELLRDVLPSLERVSIEDTIRDYINKLFGVNVPDYGYAFDGKVIIPLPGWNPSFDRIRPYLKTIDISTNLGKLRLTLPSINYNGLDIILVPVTKGTTVSIKGVPKTTVRDITITSIPPSPPPGKGGAPPPATGPGRPPYIPLPKPPIVMGAAPGAKETAAGPAQREILVL